MKIKNNFCRKANAVNSGMELDFFTNSVLQNSEVDVKYKNMSLLLELSLYLTQLNRFQFYTYIKI